MLNDDLTSVIWIGGCLSNFAESCITGMIKTTNNEVSFSSILFSVIKRNLGMTLKFFLELVYLGYLDFINHWISRLVVTILTSTIRSKEISFSLWIFPGHGFSNFVWKIFHIIHHCDSLWNIFDCNGFRSIVTTLENITQKYFVCALFKTNL